MPREGKGREKWVDMPLSIESNSNRTHRSYFVVSKGQQLRTNRDTDRTNSHSNISSNYASKQRTLDVSSRTRNDIGNDHRLSIDAREHRMSPKFASITDIPPALADQRSTTPYLGSTEDQENPQKPELVSTHQLLMMTASSITPMS